MPDHGDLRTRRPAPPAAPAREVLDDVEYVLPLRWTSDDELDDLTDYLGRLARLVPVTVVDGSPEPLYGTHARAWGRLVRHVRPDRWPALNGKVRGVMTGVLLSRGEKVVVADDDVRYDALALTRVAALLDTADVVLPQNAFDPLPWHARWDSARSLVNRGLGGDWPGTLAVRRSTLLRAGGYDGHVLFENLELVRTVAAAGGRVRRAGGVVVRRRPPTARHFWSQRTRQAYDDLAQPARLAVEAA
ncbi:glycosyltransferase, partial [Cellulomonas massiliensis]|uniref:glycosyltransferase n=1 Tax=Cellulomonas massiliensis TaxID=1465811 RepID=UPI0013755D81